MARLAATRYTKEMADIINLRLVRKAKARLDKEKAAAQNRAKFGRTKDEKSRDNASKKKADDFLEQSLRVSKVDERIGDKD